MGEIHEPRKDFVERLEWQIGADIRRRNREASAPRPAGPSRRQLIFGALALALVSMITGGVVVAAAYQSQANQERQALAAIYERRLELATLRLSQAKTAADQARRRAQVGAATQEAVIDADLKVTEAEAEVQSLRLQVAEVRATGREPRSDVSAPLVAGRDFVTERWQLDLMVQEAAFSAERTRLDAADRRFRVGLANAESLDGFRARVAEFQNAVEAFRKRLALRQEFARGAISAETAELRMAEIEALTRRQALESQLTLAKKRLAQAEERVRKGLADSFETTAVSLRIQELQYEIMKADYDLMVIKRRLAGKEQ